MLRFCVLLLLAYFSAAHAGGAFLYEIGTPDLGYASAGWAARAEDPSTVFTNPAGMTRLPCCQLQGGAMPIFNACKFHPNKNTTVKGTHGNGSSWIPSGSLFYTQQVSDCITAGIGSLGYFGSSLPYKSKWVGRYYLTKAVLQGFTLTPAVAYRFCPEISVGLGLNIMYAILESKSRINNSLDQAKDGKLRVKDNRFGCGVNAGLLFELNSCARFGLQYLSEVKLKFKDKPNFQHIGPRLNDLLLAAGVLNSQVKVNVNVPQSVMLSFYSDLNDCFALLGNLGWQQWSNFNTAEIVLGAPTDRQLTVALNYQDTWHAALGVKYNYSECLALTCGTAYDSSAVNKKNRTFSFPVGQQWRFGVGALYALQENLELILGYELLWQGTLPVHENRGPLVGTVAGSYKGTSAHFMNAGFKWIF